MGFAKLDRTTTVDTRAMPKLKLKRKLLAVITCGRRQLQIGDLSAVALEGRNRRPSEIGSVVTMHRNAATNTMIAILANSPGWIDSGPSRSHSFAPLTSDMLAGRTPGSTSRARPPTPIT
jgi:hypothetical protein